MSKKIIKSNNLLTAYIVKSVISSIAVSALFLLIFSEIIIKLDLGDTYYNIFSVAVLVISSLITPLISTGKIKNNILIMSLISNSLLIIITLINAFSIKNIILTVSELTAILLSFLAGIPIKTIPSIIGTGFSGTFTSIGIVIILGALIGTILEKTGGALKLSDMVIKVVGK